VHVLVLNHYALPREASGGTRHVELFERLPKPWTFQIVAADRNNHSRARLTATDARFRFLSIPAYDSNGARRILGWVVFAVKAVLYGVRTKRPDVVYGSSPHLLSALAGLVIARVRRVPFVLEVRDIWPESLIEFGYLERGSLVHRVLSRLERRLYRSADHVVIVAAGWRDYFASMGVGENRLSVVTNGAEPSDFDPQPDAAPLATRLGVEGPVAVYAGAHGPPNGLDHILNAAQDWPDVTFALFGDGATKSALVARADREQLTNVRFCDPVPKAELASFLWTADIGIHTLADMELFKLGMSPNKLYDYMAAGLPVITNAGGLAASILTESGAGVGVGPDAVAVGVGQILDRSPDERQRMGAAGREWLTDNASREAMAARLADTLDRVSSEGRATDR
jgi:glycosyltransferase involved in cell wall biosynthesis